MNFNSLRLFSLSLAVLIYGLVNACSSLNEESSQIEPQVAEESALVRVFGGNIDLDNLENYAQQDVPAYIQKDNSQANLITDAGATLGRVLFYDKNLSQDNSISCSSCHQQSNAFGDGAIVSTGVAGTTGRHSMRLVNARFSEEVRFFWDERAATLEAQSTQPIQDHIEMGFSGTNGDPDFNDLITKLQALDYYQELFQFVYGDTQITEARMQECLAQFIRSIQSFDSPFDQGRAQVTNDRQDFPNFSNQENQGKALFLDRANFDANGLRSSGGLGCGGCHRSPEFDIAPNSRNNGVIDDLSSPDDDLGVTRSPTLRDVVKINGMTNGPLMHTGEMASLSEVLDHYNQITQNAELDNRLRGGATGQNLNMTNEEKAALIAFLQTLSGTNVYQDSKWADPFLE